jgi:hypothetical protein
MTFNNLGGPYEPTESSYVDELDRPPLEAFVFNNHGPRLRLFRKGVQTSQSDAFHSLSFCL